MPPPSRTIGDAETGQPAHDVGGSTDTAPPSPGATVVGGEPDELSAQGAAELAGRLAAVANSVIAGKPEVIDTAIATLLSGGHLLIEDIPGVGKTLLAQVIARSLGGTFGRIQGTSDLLPGDVTGSMVPASNVADTRDGAVLGVMAFRPGPVFANVVVFDELNRTTPRTQSALLELTEEATVSVDGVSHPLPKPFMLVATQNPIEIAGTYGLGEGSLDRFTAVVTPGRASRESELEVLTGRHGRSRLDGVRPVATRKDVVRLRAFVASVHVADPLVAYVIDLLAATRVHPAIRLGASTRGGVALIALARARAVMDGRTYVVPDDIVSMAIPALAHRLIPVESNSSLDTARAVVAECVSAVAPPSV